MSERVGGGAASEQLSRTRVGQLWIMWFSFPGLAVSVFCSVFCSVFLFFCSVSVFVLFLPVLPVLFCFYSCFLFLVSFSLGGARTGARGHVPGESAGSAETPP